MLNIVLLFATAISCFATSADSLSYDSVLKKLSGNRNTNPVESIKYAEKFLTKVDTSVKTKLLGRVYDELGVNYKKISRFAKALEYHDKAKKIFIKLNDTLGIAFTLSNIGNIYRHLGQYETALQFYNESLKLKELLKNKKQIAYTLSKIGMTYTLLEKNKEAKEHLYNVYKLYSEIGDSLRQANILHSLALIELNDGYIDKAEKMYLKSLRLYEKLNQKLGEAVVKLNLSNFYLKNKEFEKAKEYVHSAINLFKSLKSQKYLAESYKSLSSIYAALGKYDLAYKHYVTYSELLKEVMDNVSTDKLNMYKELFSSELKEKENKLLKNRNKLNLIQLEKAKHQRNFFVALGIISFITILFIYNLFVNKKKAHQLVEEKNKELSMLNEKLNESNSTKDKLFSLISHDIRNPFATIINYAELFYKDYNELKDDDKLDFAKRIYFASTNVNDILDNILAWANSQRNNLIVQKKEIVLKDLFSAVKSKIDHVLLEKNIELVVEANCNKVVFTDEFMVQTIVLNLLSNAIKYSHEGSKVILGHKCSDKYNKIFVRDFGVGIEPEKIGKLFHTRQISSEGTKNEKGLGIGLTICKEFSDKLGAKLRVESQLNEGTTFILELPLT